jgi:hypothetical protein
MFLSSLYGLVNRKGPSSTNREGRFAFCDDTQGFDLSSKSEPVNQGQKEATCSMVRVSKYDDNLFCFLYFSASVSEQMFATQNEGERRCPELLAYQAV